MPSTVGLVQAAQEVKAGPRFVGPLAADEAGGLTLPAELLAQAGLDAGDDLICEVGPAGLRLTAGLAALEALGVERAADGQLTALIEIDSEHCATCYADGIQMATGCTFGKGNIRKLGYGKFVLTLVDNRTGRSVRVATRNEVIKRNQDPRGRRWAATQGMKETAMLITISDNRQTAA